MAFSMSILYDLVLERRLPSQFISLIIGSCKGTHPPVGVNTNKNNGCWGSP